MATKLPSLKFVFSLWMQENNIYALFRVIVKIRVCVKWFAYSRCSIIACISIVTITWDLVLSYVCLFRYPHNTWKGTIKNKTGTVGQNFPFLKILSGQARFIHLLHIPLSPLLSPSLSGESSFQFNWENRSNQKWISTYTSNFTQMPFCSLGEVCF